MNNSILLRKIFVSFLSLSMIAVSSLGYNRLFATKADAEEVEFNIVQEDLEEVSRFRLNNILSLANRSSVARNGTLNPLEEFAENHPNGFDIEMARNSNYVVFQEETFDSRNSIENTGEVASTFGEWSDDEGYMTIYTTAYHVGYTPTGNARYRITAEIDFHQTFSMRHEEQLIINHSANGVFDSTGSEWGTMYYHASLHNHNAYMNPPIDEEEDVTLNLSPSYSQGSGICFKFEWPEDKILYNNMNGPGKIDVRNVYSNWYLTANYYVIATNDTNVAVSYIHNEKLAGGNLSVGFGAYGVSVNITIDGSNTGYYARPILIYNI